MNTAIPINPCKYKDFLSQNTESESWTPFVGGMLTHPMSLAKLTQPLPDPENGEGYQLLRNERKKKRKNKKSPTVDVTKVKKEKKTKKGKEETKVEKKETKKIKYQPIEYFFQTMKNYELIEWLSERIGVLRSVFELFRSNEPVFKTSIPLTEDGSISCEINRRSNNSVNLFVPSVDKANYHNQQQDVDVQLFFLADGTALSAYRQGDTFILSRFCFEESTDDDFARIVRESQAEPPARRKK